MNHWFVKNLGDAMLAGEAAAQIQRAFHSEYAKGQSPAEMAVFARHESEGRLHCELVLYFTPAAIDVARACNARPCNQPGRDGLALLAGSEQAWSLFPTADKI